MSWAGQADWNNERHRHCLGLDRRARIWRGGSLTPFSMHAIQSMLAYVCTGLTALCPRQLWGTHMQNCDRKQENTLQGRGYVWPSPKGVVKL